MKDKALGISQLLNKSTIKAYVTVLVILSLVLHTGCVSRKAYEGNITEFSYHYGSFFGGYYEYDLVLQDDNTVHFTASGANGIELDIDKEVDPSVLEELFSVIADNQLEKWDSFSKSDDNVLDGYGFSLLVTFSDERTLTVNGYERYPKNYREVHDQLVGILESAA